MRRFVFAALVIGSVSAPLVACGSAAEDVPAIAVDGGTRPTPGAPPSPTSSASSAPSADAAPPPPSDDGGKPAEPPAPPPKADEITEQQGIFVALHGAAGAQGTRQAPLQSIAEAIAKASADAKGRVFVCEGTYLEAVELANGISLVGGLDCSGPTWKLTDKRSAIESPTSPAIRASGITTPTRVDHFNVSAPDASTPSGSSIGLLAVDSNALTFANGSIRAGSGMKGDDGVEGAQLVAYSAFTAEQGVSYGAVPSGELPFPRDGGRGGITQCLFPDMRLFKVANGGNGGPSGVFNRSTSSAEWVAIPGGSFVTRGAVTPAGANGVNGASSTGGQLGDEGYVPGDGTPGTDGDVGTGGAGGNGQPPPRAAYSGVGRHYGTSGPGGGAGGCPGLAGTAGKGGGASFGAALVRSPVRFDTVVVESANGGAGGRGAVGSNATPGSKGGNDNVFTADETKSYPGGAGGTAGISGSGAGGPSVAIAYQGLAPIQSQTTTRFGIGGAGVDAVTQGGRTLPASPSGAATGTKSL